MNARKWRLAWMDGWMVMTRMFYDTLVKVEEDFGKFVKAQTNYAEQRIFTEHDNCFNEEAPHSFYNDYEALTGQIRKLKDMHAVMVQG